MFVKYSDLRVGQTLQCDSGFTCLEEGSLVPVHYEPLDKEFWVPCNCHRHYLISEDDSDEVIGFYLI